MSNSIESVDYLILASHGNWKFDQQVSESFDSHVIKSVPFYEEIQRMVVEISEYFIKDNSVIYDIGSSTGTTLSLLSQQHISKKNIITKINSILNNKSALSSIFQKGSFNIEGE